MTTKVGLASVSYGIGVQNRYSAFLEDEDGFALVAQASQPALARRPAQLHIAGNKQQQKGQPSSKQAQNGPSTSTVPSSKLNGKANANKLHINNDNKHDQQQNKRQQDVGKRQRANNQQQQQQQQHHHQSANVQSQAQHKYQNSATSTNNKQGNLNQENTANTNNRFSRNQHHQTTASHQYHNSVNKENNTETGQQQQAKLNSRNNNSASSNQRQANGRRQFQQTDYRKPTGQPTEDGAGTQSLEEEKRRRQFKRALDLKHKDPEKREARRQQSTVNNQSENAQEGGDASKEKQRGNRRNLDDTSGRPFRGRGRGRRSEGQEAPANGVTGGDERRSDGQQGAVGRPQRDKPQRNRNGFGTGSRGSRGSRGDGDQARGFGREEKQKPIPNFSDKLDFPSLAS